MTRSVERCSGTPASRGLRSLFVLVLAAGVLVPHSAADAAETTNTEISVVAGADDAEESATGSMSLTSSDLELVVDSTRGEQVVGIRFTGVDVPAGAKIDDAFIQFQADETNDEPTDLRIEVEATDDAAPFADVRYDISSRSRSVGFASWSPPAWNSGDAGLEQRTPQLASLVQEIVDRPGWASNSAMVFMISGTGKRVAEAYDGVPAAAPRLHIVFSAAVSVRVVDDEAIEGADPVDTGVFRFTRSDPVDLDMIVDYAVAGSASPGGDYIALAGTATIPAGAHSVDVVVTALDDAEVEGSEDVVVTVLERPDYVVGSWPSASIRLLDDDMPTVTAAAADGVAVEGAEPPNEAVFSFVRSGPTDQELVVNYVVEGDATPGTDYAGLSGSVTIDAGASSADVPVSALDDIASEQPESVAITVVPGEGYQVGSPESASITIVDNDPILDLRVSGSRDDAEENAAGEVSRSSSDLELIFDPTNGDQVVGVRFAAVNVAPGTTITSAWLQFQTNDVSLDPASLTIEAEAADNATGFSGAAFDVSGRSRTLTSVSWHLGVVGAAAIGHQTGGRFGATDAGSGCAGARGSRSPRMGGRQRNRLYHHGDRPTGCRIVRRRSLRCAGFAY